MPRDGSAGFTLVELLVSLVAGTLLVAILASMLGDMRIAWRSDAGRQSAEPAALAARLDALLTGIVPAEAGSGETSFEGSADRLVALVVAPDAVATLGLVRLALEVRPSGSAFDLVARIEPEDDGRAGGYPAQVFSEQVLAAGVVAARFSYLGAGSGAPADSWPASGRPPAAIRIELERPQPQLVVVRPVANTDGRCLFDTVSLACRLQTAANARRLPE